MKTMNLLRYMFYIILIVLVSLCLEAASSSNDAVSFNLENHSGSTVSFSWVHPKSRVTKQMKILKPNDDITMETTVGHTFQIEELSEDSSVPDYCPQGLNGKCGKVNFIIKESHSHTILIKAGLTIVTLETSKTDGNLVDFVEKDDPEAVIRCQTEAKERLVMAKSSSPEEALDAIQQWQQCAWIDLAKQLKQVNDELDFHSTIRRDLSYQIENYTCVDPDLESTPDLEQRQWINDRDQQTRLVHVKLDRPTSRIHVVENFASENECLEMELTAEPKLRDAAVADGKGGSRVSAARKALQSGIIPKWSLEADGDPITTLSRRVYDYTNHVLGLNITEHGQEPLMSIQYFGRGYNDTEPDRYLAHCDGQCNGRQHQYGTRVATMVIYCTVPERGGHTNFQNSAVHVKPSKGNAIFFSYIDPETKKMDMGLTQHSGCPVYEGEKKIVTQWVRYGVDTDNPWNSLNSCK